MLVSRPCTTILRPGSMPGMSRRPSQTSSTRPVPSHSSASIVRVLPRGRSVTARSVPATSTISRCRLSAIGTGCRTPASSVGSSLICCRISAACSASRLASSRGPASGSADLAAAVADASW